MDEILAHEIPYGDDTARLWRASYDCDLQEFILVSDPQTHEILVTGWDRLHFCAGGEYDCHGCRIVWCYPLPAWLMENLDG